MNIHIAVSLKCALAGYSCLSPPRSDGTNQWTVLRPTNTCTILRLVCHTKSVKRQRWICVCDIDFCQSLRHHSFVTRIYLISRVSVMKLRNFQRYTLCVNFRSLSFNDACFAQSWMNQKRWLPLEEIQNAIVGKDSVTDSVKLKPPVGRIPLAWTAIFVNSTPQNIIESQLKS